MAKKRRFWRLSHAYTFTQTWSQQETLLDTPETLPTSEPATPQVQYTVASDNLPVFNFTPEKKVYVGLVVVSGRCVTAGTIYYRMKKNGASVATGSSAVSANYYWTWNCGFYDVGVGDVLEVAVWSSVTNSDWRFKGMCVGATRVAPFLNRIYVDCYYNLRLQLAYTLGNPSGVTQVVRVWAMDTASFLEQINTSKTYEVQYPKPNYGLYRLQHGDYTENNGAVMRTSSTWYPNYSQNYYPNFRFRLVED